MKPTILHHEAREELDEAVAWYETKQLGLGHRLLDEVLGAFDRLESNPGIGARYSKRQRFYRLKHFPYIVYYQEFADRLWIGAIAHERRRPGYWKRRKPE